jgi:lipoprotein-anchoring transpeptidase ErfK/SrfK
VDEADGGGYIFGGALAAVLPPAVPPLPENVPDPGGTFADVNLTLNVITAYQDGQPVKMMLTSPGRPGYETDTGVFRVQARLYSQTMTGPGYSVPNVPYVQYFYGGEAIHGRYWTLPDEPGTSSLDIDETGMVPYADAIAYAGDGPNVGVALGVPSSHGCLGLRVEDSAWLYQVLSYGSTVVVHY